MDKHENFETFDCESCKKKFVTRWRLEKHTKMHSNPNIKICKYFYKNEPCPFDKLNCEFKHFELNREEHDEV